MTGAPAFACVVFDCDSTLSRIEGIDELCRHLPPAAKRKVAALTAAAMDGEVPLEAVYARRLEIVRPSRADLEALGARYLEERVPGASHVVATLRRHGVAVQVVSGGLEPPVRAFARRLGLADEDVHAVGVVLDGQGAYVDFDRASPLARRYGKVEVLEGLRRRSAPLLFVGDGVTDLEAKAVVDLFVGFGGVVRRPAVERGADVYVADSHLGFVLDLVLPGLKRSGGRPAPRAR